MATEQFRPTSQQQLYHIIEQYIRDNKSSLNLPDRYLSSELDPILEKISQIKNKELSERTAADVKAFRANEIKNEIISKRGELQKLEEDYNNLTEKQNAS